MTAALFDIEPAATSATVVDGIRYDIGPGGTLLAPVCLRCGRPWRECEAAPGDCLIGPQRWEATSGLSREQFTARVTALVGGA